ncbi:MAG: sigma factor-like helix-turn-helix DNA-binding protein [Patescibacteria group bacterium]
MSIKLTFKPKQVVKRLLSALPPRAADVVVNRYGLGKTPEKMTLEAIGKTYKITRERVRQIENYSFGVIRKSPIYTKEKAVFEDLQKVVDEMGNVVTESHFLKSISEDASVQNNIHFLLVLGDAFKKRKEDEHFSHRWFIDDSLANKVESALKKLYETLEDEALIPESEMISSFLDNLKEVSEKYRNEEIAKRWLGLSKKIGHNPLGEWGISNSPNIKAKGMRDFAYLSIRRHGSPMHFTEVAKSIKQLFDREAHVATCHNELIKDKRFVLVGRGLYALSEWGYSSGVVKDVIREIIKKYGPLSKQEVVDKVLKERYVKENTIAVNLQNQKFFKKNKEGKYSIV